MKLREADRGGRVAPLNRQRAGRGLYGRHHSRGGGAGRRSASRRPNATAGREGDGVARKDLREQLKVRRQEPADRLPRRKSGQREEDVGVLQRVGERRDRRELERGRS